MRRLLILMVGLIASVWLGVIVARHPGYVFIMYQPWTVQMPLWFATLSLILVFAVFYAVFHGLDYMRFCWHRFKDWLYWRREHQSFTQTQQGLSALIEGRWKKAEYLLLKGIQESVEPLINYLGAAKAAQALGAPDRREAYIKKAYQLAPKAEVAIGLIQAELEMAEGHYEQATGIMTHLNNTYPRHARVLELLEKLYIQTGAWSALKSLLPNLSKAKLVTKDQYAHLEVTIYVELLREVSAANREIVEQAWEDFPRHIKKQADVMQVYLGLLQKLTLDDPLLFTKIAQPLIRKQLKSSWHDGLATIYSQLSFVNYNQQLVIVGDWVKQYGNQPILLRLLAQLCIELKLWGRAKEYFEKCLQEGANPETAYAYGHLLEQLGETDSALKVYRAGLLTY